MEEKAQEINITTIVTASEEEIGWVRELSKGRTATIIAKDSNTNKNTFAYKLANLRKKFACDTNNELVACFIRNKLIE